MFSNYLTAAFRNLKKHRFYSFINILGLSIGLTCFILISLYVKDELTYDQFHSDAENIYRMDFSGSINGNEFVTALASVPAAETMINDFPEVIDATRFRTRGERLIKVKGSNQNFKEEKVTYADANFFQFFDFELLQGDEETVLERPNTIAISEKVAKKVFGNENPIGQTLVMSNEFDFEVTGVFADMPAQSHFHFDLILAMEGLDEAKQKFWMSFNFNTYLKLQPGTSPSTIETKLPGIIEKYIGPEIQQFLGKSLEEFAETGDYAGFYLFPLKDIHLYSDKLGELEPNGDINYIYIFSAIALFILLLACINFMNLATARSASRAKEVGVRKTMGAYRSHLIYQFLFEAILICIVSFLIALGLSAIALPGFEELAKKTFFLADLFSPVFVGALAGTILLVGIMAGSYPAFYLSKFRPVEVLKGKLTLGMKSGGLRSVLVVLQFTVSIIMIVGTAIVFDQLSFIQNKKLGFEKDQIIMIDDPWLMGDKVDAYKTEALRNTKVLKGTIATFLPVNTTNNNNLWFKGQTAGSGDNHVFHNYRIDEDYLETLGMELVAGRNFSREFPNDTTKILINESAARQLGFDDPINQFMSTYGGSQENPTTDVFQVIGVVKDFHYRSLRDRIDPLIFTLDDSRGYISFKLSTEDISGTISFLRTKWDEFAPGQPFEYEFLDDEFSAMYESEEQIGDIFSVFAILSIFIACLGLYALASFTAEQRTKEIGIRKVLGASIQSIISLLSKEFSILVGISIIIASGTAYFLMNEWLADFEYRTTLNITTFLLAGAVAFVIASLTMGSQAYQAARINPARSLKDE